MFEPNCESMERIARPATGRIYALLHAGYGSLQMSLTAELATLQTHARLSAARPVSVTLDNAITQASLSICSRGHYHDYNEVFIVERGTCGHRSEAGEVSLGPGSVVLAPRGAVHCNPHAHEAVGTTIRYLAEWLVGDLRTLAAERERLAPFVTPPVFPGESGAGCLVFPLDGHELARCRSDCEAIARELEESEPSALYLRAAMMKVFVVFGRACARAGEGRAMLAPAIWEAIQRIEAQITSGEPVNLAEIAEAAGMTPWQFSRAFKRETDHTPQAYCQHRRIQVACSLLLDTRYTVTDIAYQLGYRSGSNFAAMFRKYRGMTPSDYRRRYA